MTFHKIPANREIASKIKHKSIYSQIIYVNEIKQKLLWNYLQKRKKKKYKIIRFFFFSSRAVVIGFDFIFSRTDNPGDFPGGYATTILTSDIVIYSICNDDNGKKIGQQ